MNVKLFANTSLLSVVNVITVSYNDLNNNLYEIKKMSSSADLHKQAHEAIFTRKVLKQKKQHYYSTWHDFGD